MKKITFLLLAILAISFSSCKDDEDEITDITVIVTGVSLNTNTLSLALGGESTLTATISPANATNATVTWTTSDATKATVTNGKVMAVALGTATITATVGSKTATCAVTISMPTVTDADGNVYHTITIGTQTWMVENLKVTKYNDGTAIPNVTDNTAWKELTTGALCDYDNTPSNSETYGKLYNWHAVNTGKLCPTGWHVPSDAEWTKLTDYLGGESVAGGKLKETGTTHWASPNTGATNETGFTALPGGRRGSNGTFHNIGSFGEWWSATKYNATTARFRNMKYDLSHVYSANYTKEVGFSVRCVRD